ncbi:unnamed protein product [Calypogeia fissa]
MSRLGGWFLSITGKLAVIEDVINQNRALVDSPGIVRTQVNFKRLSLTDIKIDIARNSKKKELKAAIDAADVAGKWEKSSWGRKLIFQKKRASLNDFDRFKVMVARIKRGAIIKKQALEIEEGGQGITV